MARLGRARPQRQILTRKAVLPPPSGRIMSKITGKGGGLAGKGGIAGKSGGLAG